MLGKSTILVSALVALLVAVPVISAQQQVVATHIEGRADPLQSAGNEVGFDRNASTQAFVFVRFCIDEQGGLNPQSGSYSVEMLVSGVPEWLTVSPPSDSLSFQPANDPTTQGCGPESQLEYTITFGPDAPYGTSASFSADLGVTKNGDTGTYEDPAGVSVTVNVQVIDEPAGNGDGLPGNGGGDGGDGSDGGDGGDGGDTEDSPAPGPMLVILAVLAFAAFRRRQ